MNRSVILHGQEINSSICYTKRECGNLTLLVNQYNYIIPHATWKRIKLSHNNTKSYDFNTDWSAYFISE